MHKDVLGTSSRGHEYALEEGGLEQSSENRGLGKAREELCSVSTWVTTGVQGVY